MDLNWPQLWTHLADRFGLGDHSIHGPDHWRRVERHAVALAKHNAGNLVVVRLFAVFHDVCRENDGADPDHGARGAALAALLRGEWFDLPDAEFALLEYACIHHTSGYLTEDPTIGACWDADPPRSRTGAHEPDRSAICPIDVVVRHASLLFVSIQLSCRAYPAWRSRRIV